MNTLFALLIGLHSLAPAPVVAFANDTAAPEVVIEGVDFDASRVTAASRLV